MISSKDAVELARGSPEPCERKRHSVLVSGAHTVLTNLVQVVGVFATTTILARTLGPTGKGIYDVYISASFLLSSLLSCSLNGGISYSVASSKVNLSNLLRIIWFVVGLQVFVGILVCRAISKMRLSRAIIPVELGVSGEALVLATVALLGLAALWRSLAIGQRHFLAANAGDITKQVTSVLALLLSLKLLPKLHLSSTLLNSNLVLLAIGSNMIAVAFAAFSYRRAIDRTESHPEAPSGIRRAIKFAMPSHVANVSQFLNARMDVFFVYHYWGAASVGLYQVGVMIAQAVNMIPQSTQAVLFPTISSKDQPEQSAAQMVARANRVLFCFGLIGATILAAASPYLLPRILGERFRPSVLGLIFLLPGCVTFIATNITAAYFSGIGRPDLNMRNSLHGLVATVLLDFLLIPHWGFYGAAIASSVSYTVTTVGQVVVFCQKTRTPIRQLFVPDIADVRRLKSLVTTIAFRQREIRGSI